MMKLTDQQARERQEAIANHDFEEGILCSVQDHDDSWSLDWNETGEPNGSSTGCGAPKVEGAPVPAVGMRVRVYGRFGSPLKGADLEGEPLFFRTHAEREAKREQWRQEKRRKDQSYLDAHRDAWDAEVAAWPEEFRARIEGFRERGGEGWRRDFEGYELAACRAALRLVRGEEPDPERQLSGNQGEFAEMLAKMFQGGEAHRIPDVHGAMTPIVGCAAYACPHPRQWKAA